jgi:hypothetical protein
MGIDRFLPCYGASGTAASQIGESSWGNPGEPHPIEIAFTSAFLSRCTRSSPQNLKLAANAMALLTLMLIPGPRVAPTWPVPMSKLHRESGACEILTA